MKCMFICYVCGKEFHRYLSTVKVAKPCCSKACRDISFVKNETYKGRKNPNYKNGKWVSESYCTCGNPKDMRSKQCSSCARVSFSKQGAKNIFDIDETSLRDIVYNSLSVYAVSKIVGISRRTVATLIEKYKIDISHFVVSGKAKRYLNPNLVLVENSTFETSAVRSCIFRNDLLKYQCSVCGQGDVWQGKKLVLQLHHKNGKNRDHRLENVTFLCPNCHTQTETYTGGNIKRANKNKMEVNSG